MLAMRDEVSEGVSALCGKQEFPNI